MWSAESSGRWSDARCTEGSATAAQIHPPLFRPRACTCSRVRPRQIEIQREQASRRESTDRARRQRSFYGKGVLTCSPRTQGVLLPALPACWCDRVVTPRAVEGACGLAGLTDVTIIRRCHQWDATPAPWDATPTPWDATPVTRSEKSKDRGRWRPSCGLYGTWPSTTIVSVTLTQPCPVRAHPTQHTVQSQSLSLTLRVPRGVHMTCIFRQLLFLPWAQAPRFYRCCALSDTGGVRA